METDGISENSVPSVLKKTCEVVVIWRRIFWGHAEIIFGTQSRRGLGVVQLRCRAGGVGKQRANGLRRNGEWEKRMQVSVVSGHRVAMLRAIKVCRMVIPKFPCYPC